MARRKVVEEDESKEPEADEKPPVEDLTLEDFFDQEIDYGEYEEIEKALQTPAGHYVTQPRYEYKARLDEIKVLVEEDGLHQEHTIKRPSYRYWGKTINADTAAEQFLGIAVSPKAIYSEGSGENRRLYLEPVNGARPDFLSQFWVQAVKLYKAEMGERAKTVSHVLEFLAERPLILTNREGKKRDDEEVARTFVVGFKLA
jgi:hypothetical protein